MRAAHSDNLLGVFLVADGIAIPGVIARPSAFSWPRHTAVGRRTTTEICLETTFPLAKIDRRRIMPLDPVGRIRPQAGAEGATAPETLRPKDQQGADGTLERSAFEALAEGITISGERTEGAHREAQNRAGILSRAFNEA
jgi:hypothetical protein